MATGPVKRIRARHATPFGIMALLLHLVPA
jgi:hypothetical protein